MEMRRERAEPAIRRETMGGLTVRIAGDPSASRGIAGPVLVLLHGWAAPADDLVPLGAALDAPPGTIFVFPEGPLHVELGAGASRAWWAIDMERLDQDLASGRPRNLSREIPPGLAPARSQLMAMLEDLQAKLELDPRRIVLGGFSQGAMLACDVALRIERPVGGLAVLSGTVLARDEWIPLMPRRKGLPVLQAHGRSDGVLPFFLAEQLRDHFREGGLPVDWVGFDGGHEIPEEVLARLGRYLHRLFPSSRKS